MKHSRNKIILVATLGVAGLTLVGVGAGASFTDAVKVTQTIKTGSLDLEITGIAFQGYDPSANDGQGGLGDSQDLTGYRFPSKAVNLGVSGNNGSHLDERYAVTVKNFGTLPARLSCFLTGKDVGSQMALDTTVVQADNDLSSTESAGNSGDYANLCPGSESPIVLAPQGSTTVSIEFQSPDDGYTNADQGGTISPIFNVQALEVPTANSAPAAP